MSTISDAIKNYNEVRFLLVLDFGGIVRRYSTENVTVSDYFFDGLITSEFDLGSSFDLRTLSYSNRRITIEIINRDRLQDLEAVARLNGGIGKIYIWAPGLTWSDIETDGLIFTGWFQKVRHDRFHYSFTLTDFAERRWKSIPETTITADNWPTLRTTGGSGSVAGAYQPILFGNWSKGIPLKCVHTTNYIYLAHANISKTTEAEYNAGTFDVYDKDGSVIDPTGYTFYPSAMDGEGMTVAYFDFTADQVTLEPLTCSIKGVYDGGGDITGTDDQLIEHPADIIYYLMRYHSHLLPSEIHVESIKTLRSILPGLKFASIINAATMTNDVIDRLLKQCLASRITYGTGVGIVTMSESTPASIVINTETDTIGKGPIVSQTSADDIVNRVRVQYALNPSGGGYESELVKDRNNDTACKRSYHHYGEQPEYTWQMADVHNQFDVRHLVDRLLWLKAFPHDLVEFEVPYWIGFDLREGDAALITMPEGSSSDGEGWDEEKCILVERIFKRHTIAQTWWRVAV